MGLKLRGFLSELRRRRVGRGVTAYAFPRGSRWPTSSCRGCSFPNGASRVVRPAPLIESLVVLPFENLRLEQEYVVRASWGG